jgi:hypothetical protein
MNQTAKAERVRLLRLEVARFADRILDEIANNATVRLYTNHTQRIDVIRCVEAQKARLNSPENTTTKDPRVLTGFQNEFKRCIGPVYRRIDENRTLWKEVGRLDRLLQEGRHFAKKWRDREMPGDGPVIYRFEQKLKRIDLWFNETVKTLAQSFEPHKGTPIRPKQVAEKATEFRLDLTAAKKVLGGSHTPRLIRGGGGKPTGEDQDKLKQMDFIKNMRNMELEDAMASDDEGNEL